MKNNNITHDQLEGKLRDKVTELSILNEISEVLLSTQELNEILHTILIGATAHQALGFNRAFLFLLNEQQTELLGTIATGPLSAEEAYKIWGKLTQVHYTLKDLLKSRRGEYSKEDEPINNLVKSIVIPLQGENSIFKRVVEEKQSFNIKNGTVEHPLEKSIISRLGTNTFALVPLVAKEKVLGVLLADNYINKRPISDEDVERLRTFANQASLAIENAALYKQLKHKIEELRTAYEELKRNRDRLTFYERLTAVGKAATTITHEIRNPLVSIGGFARLALKKNQVNEESRNYLKIIVDESVRLEKILSDILTFTKSPKIQCEIVGVNDLIKNALEILAPEIAKQSVTIEEDLTSDLPPLLLDKNQIGQVLINLMRNALEAMPEGGTLTISSTSQPHWVSIEIADTGTGIPDEDLDKVFDAFFTSKAKGTGLGLTISAQIINGHGGTIEIRKRKPQGTISLIKLPADTNARPRPGTEACSMRSLDCQG